LGQSGRRGIGPRCGEMARPATGGTTADDGLRPAPARSRHTRPQRGRSGRACASQKAL